MSETLKTLWLEQYDKNNDKKLSYNEIKEVLSNPKKAEILKKILNTRNVSDKKDKEKLEKAYQNIADNFKQIFLDKKEINRNDISTIYLFQVIAQIKWYYKKEAFNWTWNDALEDTVNKVYTKSEKALIKTRWTYIKDSDTDNIIIKKQKTIKSEIEADKKAKENTKKNETVKKETTKKETTKNTKSQETDKTDNVLLREKKYQDKVNWVDLTPEQVKNKETKIKLFMTVWNAYKAYLENIYKELKLKPISWIDEQYKNQINKISTKIQDLENILNYSNTDDKDVRKLNLHKLYADIFVRVDELSQEKTQDYKRYNVVNYNNWVKYPSQTKNNLDIAYNTLTNIFLWQTITDKNYESFKNKALTTIRDIDNNDSKLNHDSWNWIVSNMSDNIVTNKNLLKNEDIKHTFDVLKKFWEWQKQVLFDAIKSWKNNFIEYLWTINIFKNKDEIKSFWPDLYEKLKQNYNELNDSELRKQVISKIDSEFKYLMTKAPASQKAMYLNAQKQALEPSNINEMIHNVKVTSIFQNFEENIIDIKLEKNSSYVKEVVKTDNIVKMYSQIEWIWGYVSDKTKNKTMDTIQTIIEQIVIMYISWCIWGLVVEGYDWLKLLEWAWKIWKILTSSWAVAVEWTTYYASYNAINWVLNQENVQDILNSYNYYDLTRSIIFLWVLKNPALNKIKQKITPKDTMWKEPINVAFDTTSILWTDIGVRLTLWELKWREWIPTDVDWNVTMESVWDYIKDELMYIIPFVIWLRQSEASINKMFENGKKPEINIEMKRNETIIKIWEYEVKIDKLNKDIRNLKQWKNITKNKWKSTSEFNENINDKKIEKKETKQKLEEAETELSKINNELSPKIESKVIIQNNKVDNKQKDKDKKTTDSEQKNNVNINAWSNSVQKAIKDMNIENVMTWFKEWNSTLMENFNKILKNWTNKEANIIEANSLIEKEVNLKIEELKKEWKTFNQAELEIFTKEFVTQKQLEFKKLLELKESWKEITNEKIEMKTEINWKEFSWTLELKNTNEMNRYFGEWVENNKKIKLNDKTNTPLK